MKIGGGIKKIGPKIFKIIFNTFLAKCKNGDYKHYFKEIKNRNKFNLDQFPAAPTWTFATSTWFLSTPPPLRPGMGRLEH